MTAPQNRLSGRPGRLPVGITCDIPAFVPVWWPTILIEWSEGDVNACGKGLPRARASPRQGPPGTLIWLGFAPTCPFDGAEIGPLIGGKPITLGFCRCQPKQALLKRKEGAAR